MKVNIEEARQDAEKFAKEIGGWLFGIMFDLCGNFNQNWIRIEPGYKGFLKVMYGHNLMPIEDKYAFPDKPNVNIIEHWAYMFRACYAYAEGEDCDSHSIQDFLLLAERYLLLMRMQFGYLSIRGADRIAELEKLGEEISLNYATAVLKVQARLMLERGVEYARSGGKSTLPPKILAILADVTIGYIFQLLTSKKIKADKVKGNWQIDTLVALDWLQGRKDCPDWIMRL